MSIYVSIICPECGKLYDDSSRRTCIGKCHHFICLSCKSALESAKCPICDEAEAFSETVYNHETVNFLADFQRGLSEKDVEMLTTELQKIGKGVCSECSSESPKLRICTQCTPFIMKSGKGGFRASYWLEGRNATLKTKSAAICANCAIDKHDGHKVITLTSLEGISGDFEIDSIIALRILIEGNWQKDIEAKRTTIQAVHPKSLALQWRLEERVDQIRSGFIQKTSGLIEDIKFSPWKAQLEASLAKIQKYQKLLLDLRKLSLKSQKDNILMGAVVLFFRHQPTPENRKIVKETVENYELLPTELLTKEECQEYDLKVRREFQIRIEQMADRYPLRRNDLDFLRFEVIKESTIKSKEDMKKANRLIDESSHNFEVQLQTERQFSTQPNRHLAQMENVMNSMTYFHGIMQKQLEVDRAHISLFKAQVAEQYGGMMMMQCRGDLNFVLNHLPKLEEVIRQYEDVSLKGPKL